LAGRITAILTQERNPQRANVFVDGQFAFGLQMIEAAKLVKGQFLSDEDITHLLGLDEQERAHEQALHFLSYRPRSETELAHHLSRHGFSEPAIQAESERLFRAGLLDDEAFARYWVSNRDQFRPRGQSALRHELRQKGVADDIVDAILRDSDESGKAYQVALERLARWQRANSALSMGAATLRRKLTDHLLRRGFGYQVIQQVWERLHSEGLLDNVEGEDTKSWEPSGSC
jgi:regulatory protein